MNLKKAFLILAFAMVSIIALLYGIDPPRFARTFFGVDDLSVNFAHILRAIMCLYLALGCSRSGIMAATMCNLGAAILVVRLIRQAAA
jgi:hypothetical protein